MRKFRNAAAVGIAAGAVFALTACNSGSPTDPAGGGDAPEQEVADDVALEGFGDLLVAGDDVVVFVELPWRQHGNCRVGKGDDEQGRDNPTGGEECSPTLWFGS